MIFLFSFFFFFLGVSFGSFLNVLIYRLPNSLPLTGRSFCPKCKKKIAWYDNLPLLSFLVLAGRCRHCHSPISWQYPFVELVTGVLTVLSIKYLVFSSGSSLNFYHLLSIIYYLLIIYALIVIFFIDLYHEIIPDEIVYPAIIITLIFSLYPNILISNLISGFLAGLLFLILFLLTSGRGMGFGDFKLAVLMGLFLGYPKIIVALYLAFLTGAAIGVILILRGKKKLKSHIPFGPFLAGSTIFALFYGHLLWEKLIAALL